MLRRMRTTLTLEPDVAARLSQLLERSRDRTLKDVVNAALRVGLECLDAPRPAKARFETPTFSAGRCALPNLDDVSEAIAFAEGEGFR
jgi:hypothetical protein